MFTRYRRDGLEIEDVEAGLLAGSVNRGEWVDEVTVSSDGAALVAYLAAADGKRLFEEEAATFRRKAR